MDLIYSLAVLKDSETMWVLVRDFGLCGCVLKGDCDILVILFDFPAMKSAGFLCHMVLL